MQKNLLRIVLLAAIVFTRFAAMGNVVEGLQADKVYTATNPAEQLNRSVSFPGEFDLVTTVSVTGNAQHISLKKWWLQACLSFASLAEQPSSPFYLVSYETYHNRSHHLDLIYPFHYFW